MTTPEELKALRSRVTRIMNSEEVRAFSANLLAGVFLEDDGGPIKRVLADDRHPHFHKVLEFVAERGYGKVEQNITAQVAHLPVIALPPKEDDAGAHARVAAADHRRLGPTPVPPVSLLPGVATEGSLPSPHGERLHGLPEKEASGVAEGAAEEVRQEEAGTE